MRPSEKTKEKIAKEQRFLMSLFLMLLAITVAQSGVPANPDDWCYETQAKALSCPGPASWPGTCKGFMQSPVNIVISNTLADPKLNDFFTYIGYDRQYPWTIVNNGYTILVNLNGTIKISGGGLEDTYRAMYVQFHWSDSLKKGSEHTINGKPYAMEVQIIHIRDKFQKLEKAIQSTEKDAITIMGFLIQASNNKKHEGFQTILDALDQIPYKNNEVTTKPMSLYDLIPDLKDMKHFFRYKGSLTFPSCPENVIWTVFKDPLQVEEDQILQFSKKLYYNEKGQIDIPMTNNYRKMQKRGPRNIFHNRVERLLPHTWSVFLTPLLTCLLAIFLY
ncbi:carbonic anhydrase 4-like [Gracilinanus agilis]|uniref:carbonic anhydrase 4-like n=1 Tax=Gracilinanus agilis TaxID=191870 RepID=UPI001CFD9645|nr:carbonic anhydrase 4-like [Gracilinanus agilis]